MPQPEHGVLGMLLANASVIRFVFFRVCVCLEIFATKMPQSVTTNVALQMQQTSSQTAAAAALSKLLAPLVATAGRHALSFEVVPVSEAALVNSGWTSYQILDINLPLLWAWILLPSKVSMWIFLCTLIDIYYSLSPHIICEVSWMLWRWQVHDICQGQPCVQSENVKKRKLSEDISATFLPTIQQMEEHMHHWDEDPS